MSAALLFPVLTPDWQGLSPVSRAPVSVSPSIFLFLSMGAGLLRMKFQQGYEGMVDGV